jgi:hypothetical protein
MSNPNHGEVLVTYRELGGHGIPYCRLHLNRMVRRGQFPAPIWLSPNRKVWKLSDILVFKATRTTSRPAQVASDAAD